MLDRRSKHIVGANQSDATAAVGPDGNKQQKTRYRLLRSRILIDREKAGRTEALKAIERRSYETTRSKQYQKNRDSHVTLYRRYRIGDYPDFQINSLAFLMPLQALAKIDSHLARKLMVILFEAVAKAAGAEHRKLIVTLNECIKSMFARAKLCDSTFFSTLIEMALKFPNHFDFSPDALASMANETSTMALGILFVEARLSLDLLTGHGGNASGTASTIDNAEQHWSKLAEMYAQLNEHDIVADIFMDFFKSNETVGRAVDLESRGKFANAREEYIKYINDESDDDPRAGLMLDFTYESCFNCSASMGQWESLWEFLRQQMPDNIDDIWQDAWNIEHLLPHYMRTETRMTLERHSIDKQFSDNINRLLRQDEHSDYIKHNFAEELMMLQICNEDFLQARVYSEQHFIRFLAEWANLNVLSDKVRAKKILNIRNVAEIHKYADWLITENRDEPDLNKYLQRWNHTCVKASDSLQMWDILIAYREYLHHRLKEYLQIHGTIGKQMAEHIFDMQIDLADMALQQNNLELSNGLIEKTAKRLKAGVKDRYSAQWSILQSKYFAQKSTLALQTDPGQSMDLLIDSWQRIDDAIDDHPAIIGEFGLHSRLRAKALHQVANSSEKILELLPRMTSDQISDEIRDTIRIRTMNSSDKEAIEARLFDHSLKTRQSIIDLVQRIDDDTEATFSGTTIVGDTYHRMATFCLQNTKLIPKMEIQKYVVQYFLRAVRYDSKEARLQFPQILLLSEINTVDLGEHFNTEVIHYSDIYKYFFHFVDI